MIDSIYEGDGRTIGKRKKSLSDYKPMWNPDDPTSYVADPGLKNAVNLAIALGQPLLLTGEPGTGKTRLAASVAYELELPSPLEFHTKTTSVAKDMFYLYDALARFQDAQISDDGKKNIEDYIEYQALGKAVLLTQPPEEVKSYLPEDLQNKPAARSVVLIDEIDKAPRDLPNDVLNEIEKMEFTVTETDKKFKADKKLRPILILTSNSEKNLPDAFLRRCVFYHISFPDDERLAEIIEKKFIDQPGFTPKFIKSAIKHFSQIRNLSLKKNPATAECIDWIRVLRSLDLDPGKITPEQTDMFIMSYSVLAKTNDDLARLKDRLLIEK
ncbi:MoxR family ATPase [Desulfobacterales bacterium HSG16]|nr:MoxR family ATPase [Desulfobacterales bacterium HSG16]